MPWLPGSLRRAAVVGQLHTVDAGEDARHRIVIEHPHAELHVRIHDVGRAGGHHVDDVVDFLPGGDVASRRAAADAAPVDDEAAAVHVRVLAERDAAPLLLEDPVAGRYIARPQTVEVDRQSGLTDKDQGGAGECRTNEKTRYPHFTVSLRYA